MEVFVPILIGVIVLAAVTVGAAIQLKHSVPPRSRRPIRTGFGNDDVPVFGDAGGDAGGADCGGSDSHGSFDGGFDGGGCDGGGHH